MTEKIYEKERQKQRSWQSSTTTNTRSTLLSVSVTSETLSLFNNMLVAQCFHCTMLAMSSRRKHLTDFSKCNVSVLYGQYHSTFILRHFERYAVPASCPLHSSAFFSLFCSTFSQTQARSQGLLRTPSSPQRGLGGSPGGVEFRALQR